MEVTSAARDGRDFVLATSIGIVRARRLINAAGAWGSIWAAAFGEPVPESVMVPNMCVTDPIPYFIEPNLGVCGGDIYIRQIPRGKVATYAQVAAAAGYPLYHRQVARLLIRRGGRLSRIHKNDYANALRLLVRKGEAAEILDRLLISAMI